MNIPSPLFHRLSPSFFAWFPPQVTFIQYLSLFCISCAFAVLLFTLSVLSFLSPSISVWLLKALFKQASVSMTTTWKNSCVKIWEVFLPPHNEALVSLWLWLIHLLCNTLDGRCSISIVSIQNKWTEHLITCELDKLFFLLTHWVLGCGMVLLPVSPCATANQYDCHLATTTTYICDICKSLFMAPLWFSLRTRIALLHQA